MKNKTVSGFIIGTFVTLYLMVSIISTIHVIEFFRLSNPEWLAISLAIAFEVGAAASLASIIALKRMNQTLVWALFIILTLMQAMGNTYYAFTNLKDFTGWSELFDIIDDEVIFQKRILSLISGAILPIVALGFIKSLVDYIRPSENVEPPLTSEDSTENQEIKEDETTGLVDSPIESLGFGKLDSFEETQQEIDFLDSSDVIVGKKPNRGFPNIGKNPGSSIENANQNKNNLVKEPLVKKYPENL